MNEQKAAAGRGAFPIGLGSLFWMAVAGFVIYITVRDAVFYSQAKAVEVRTITDAHALKDNTLVEVHLKLDADDAAAFQFKGGDTFTIVAFKGTGRRLFYAMPRLADDEDLTKAELPIRGRAVAKDFADKWALGSGKSIKLGEVLKGDVPNEALVVSPITKQGLSWWRWAIAGIAGLYLLWIFLAVVLWMFGVQLAAEPAASTTSEESGTSGPTAQEG